MLGEKGKVVFKQYSQGQMLLFPPSLDSLIPENHLVRLVNTAVEQMDLSAIFSQYQGGGTSSYHPVMLLKILIYAYSQKIYSSREIAKAVRENVNFMWLAGGNKPDFRTINRFRQSKLRSSLEKVFASMLCLLKDAGLINLKEYFLDGTKIEANANRYSFVWRKSTIRYDKNLDKNVKELFADIDQLNNQEDKSYKGHDLAELGEDATPLTSEELAAHLKKLNQALAEPGQHQDKAKQKELKKAARQLKRDFIPRKQKYEKQQELFGDRNSYSKTDTDATFMRMKEDHMRNGQLKAGYNVQMGTEKQFITGYSLHQNSTDSTLLPPHLDLLRNRFGFTPETIIADAGYGSEENYTLLSDQGIEGIVKYGGYDGEQRKSFCTRKAYLPEFMDYDSASDCFTCPANKQLRKISRQKRKSANGFVSCVDLYESESCSGCDHWANCCPKSSGNRVIYVNHQLIGHRKKARDLLDSSRGANLRKKRMAEVESVFGQLKANGNFRRFLLRGLEKVGVEFGLLSLSHNMKKWHSHLEDNLVRNPI